MLENLLEFFVSILLLLDSIVYSLISWVYQIILVIAQVDILGNTNEIQNLVNRIYVIIGVIVLFLVAYSLLKSMVNPDSALKDKKSPINIIKDVLISVVLIALVPSIFSFASRFQNALLMENTIGKVILGTFSETTGETSEETIEDGGTVIAANILQAFLHPEYDQCTQKDDGTFDCSEVQVATEGFFNGIFGILDNVISIDTGYINYEDAWDEIIAKNNLLGITGFAYTISHESTVTYYYIISTAVGVFVLLVLLSYCIDVAIRTVKLAVYQMIAPLPILARILPGEQGGKIFSNWLKATLSTYVEIFIRLGILFFAVLLIKIVVQNLPTLLILSGLISGGTSFTVYLFAQLFIIVGIILFVKQAPGIIKEITGLDGGKYNVFGSALRTMSVLGGGVTAAVRNWNDTDHIQGRNPFTRGFNRFRSTLGGAGSAMARATMGRDDVKDLKSMKTNARNSANRAFQAHQERIAYAESHPEGVLKGHLSDQWDKVKYWAHGNVDDKRLQSIVDMAGKVGKGANDQIEDLMAMIHGDAKEQKRQLDALKNKTVEIADYFNSVMIDGEVKYVAKGTDLHDPNIRNKAISANEARQIAQNANTQLYKSAKDEFESTYSKAIASLYTVDLNDKRANIEEQRKAWGIKDNVSDEEARAQLQGFKNQITSRLNTVALDQSIAKQTDAAFNALKSLNVDDIVEQLAQNEANRLREAKIEFNINDLRAKYRTDSDAIAKQFMANIGANKGTAGEIQRDAEFKTAEAKARNAKINSDKKD